MDANTPGFDDFDSIGISQWIGKEMRDTATAVHESSSHTADANALSGTYLTKAIEHLRAAHDCLSVAEYTATLSGHQDRGIRLFELRENVLKIMDDIGHLQGEK